MSRKTKSCCTLWCLGFVTIRILLFKGFVQLGNRPLYDYSMIHVKYTLRLQEKGQYSKSLFTKCKLCLVFFKIYLTFFLTQAFLNTSSKD